MSVISVFTSMTKSKKERKSDISKVSMTLNSPQELNLREKFEVVKEIESGAAGLHISKVPTSAV